MFIFINKTLAIMISNRNN